MKVLTELVILLYTLVALLCGCAAIKERVDDRTKRDCMALCAAVEAAQCWESPGVAEGIGSAVSVVQCVESCEAQPELVTRVDMGCLRAAGDCESVRECFDVEVGR